MTNPGQITDNSHEGQDLTSRVRAELAELRRAAPGTVPPESLMAAAPLLWSGAIERYPMWSALSDLPLRHLLRDAASLMEPPPRAGAFRDLLGLWDNTYGTTLSYRRDIAAQRFNVSASSFRQSARYEPAVLDEAAACLNRLLTRGNRASSHPEDPARVPRPDNEGTILRALRGDQPARLLLTGEPGVGKSDLVDAVARQAGLPSTVIRTTEGALTEDVLSLLTDHGIAVDTMTWEAAWQRFREYLQALPSQHLLVLDNADDASLVEQVCTEAVSSHVVVISRRSLALDGFTEERLGDFTPDQAAMYCTLIGLDADATTAGALAEALGFRPLALAQAIGFLQASGHLAVDELVASLTHAPATVLDDVARALQARRNLATIYRAILAELLATSPTSRVVLDFAIWLASGTGLTTTLVEAVIGPFLRVPTPAVAIETAFFDLLAVGLIRPLTPGTDYGPSVSRFEFSPLTLELLLEIQADAINWVFGHLIRVLWEAPPLPLVQPGEEYTQGDPRLTVLNLMRNEMMAAVEAHTPPANGQGLSMPVLCINERLWLLFSPDGQPRGGLVRVSSNSLTLWASGQRLDLDSTHPSAQDIRAAVAKYPTVIAPLYETTDDS